MRDALAHARYDVLQVEYTQLARYGGDVLVEHDVTFDLFEQMRRRAPLAFLVVGLVPLAALRAER